jgi:hypothetical protein
MMPNGGTTRFKRDLLDHFQESILTGDLASFWSAVPRPARWQAEQAIAGRFVQCVKLGQD